ncbi:tripartite-type tricarboxylate transporter receptor subunit TctC [Azospirillum agricola]|uniref:tripartite tricarboxylate transporter substrate binding protein n=1 Tax=Azospirillum agricola TaxID=1720247 RepID=UPI001AE34B12|nr:tripartite tricarboxylate transporter substrate binding protein [Azospirillum agricola]MBP2231928.1 tripartite-type tricarboxylate transporter receptor subunit TctC [Azospirillum agricola]
MHTPSPLRRHLRGLAAALLAASLGVAGGAATAADFPARPIRLVAPAAPGGSPDILARTVGQFLNERVKQPVVVENKPGGAGNIAHELVARAAPDGYTLLVATDQLAINDSLFHDLSYGGSRGFAGVVQAISAPQVLVVNSTVPARSVAEFLDLARARPGEIAVATPAVGTVGHLATALLQRRTGVRLNHIVYKSAQPAIAEALSGRVQAVFVTLAPALPHIQSGALRALAVSTAERSPAVPEVPTTAEAGLKDFTFSSWQGFSAPAATPAPVLDALNAHFNAVLADPRTRTALTAQGFDVAGGTRQAFDGLVAASAAQWGDVIRAADIKPVD